MKKEFKGTKGNARFINDFKVVSGAHKICELSLNINQEFTFEELIANGELIADAFNVRQQIDCDLPELLKQRNEAVELLKNFVSSIKNEEIIIQENTDNDGWENIGGTLVSKFQSLLNKI